MIGKKNIVFGFIYFVFTAALGGVMVDMYEDYGLATQEKQTSVGRLERIKADEYEENLEPLSAKKIAMANTDAILGINKLNNVELGIDYIKGGPHAHGNLEALLNIVVGFILCFVAIAGWQKQVISWGFISGTLLHSGAMYLQRVFDLKWAGMIIESGIGPILIMASLLLMGFAVAVGFKRQMIKDAI